VANFFDQFDSPGPAPAAAPAATKNFFDQFEEPAAARPAPQIIPGQNGAPTRVVMDVSGKATAPVAPATEQPPAPQAPSFDERFDALGDKRSFRAVVPPSEQQWAPGQMATGMLNVLPAAEQGTNPNVERHVPNFLSDDLGQNDAGQTVFTDPNTGQTIPYDRSQHILLRDPRDGKPKVFARTEELDENGAVGISRVLSQGLSSGAVTRRPAIPTPTQAQITPTASQTFASAKPFYREFTEATRGIEVPKETAQGIADRLRTALDKIGLDEDMAGPAAKAALRKLESGKIADFDELQRIKRTIDYGFKSPEKSFRDGAGAMVAELRKVISEVSPEGAKSLKTADDIHSTAVALRELQNKGAVADLRKGRAGYGGNAVNSMRQVLSPIVQKAVEGKKTLFKPNEIAAMREIVEGTGVTNTLRLVGQASPSKGILASTAAGGATYAAGPVALAIPAIGAAANKLATVLTGKQIERLKDLVAKRSPAYAKAVERSVQRWEEAQMKLVNDPSPARLAAYTTASRQLANGLTRDGVQIASGDLMRAIQGPVNAAAQDEQR